MQLRASRAPSRLVCPLTTLLVWTFDRVLQPRMDGSLAELRNKVSGLLDDLDADRTNSFTEIRSSASGIIALIDAVQMGRPTPEAFNALVGFEVHVRNLSANSAAQFYIWLRHFLPVSDNSAVGFPEVTTHLASGHVAELLKSGELFSYLRIRLGTCHLMAKGFKAQSDLRIAIARMATQMTMRSPIRASAVAGAEVAPIRHCANSV